MEPLDILINVNTYLLKNYDLKFHGFHILILLTWFSVNNILRQVSLA